MQPFRLLFALVCIFLLLLVSCDSGKNVSSETSTNDSLLACKADSIKREQASKGKVSELALLMRQMESDLLDHKEAMKAGADRNLNFDHSAIHSARTTKENLRNDDFTAYANSYLMGIDALQKADGDSIPAKHNLVVSKCIDCHKTFCTGPITRIKKLHVNPANAKVGL